MRLIAFILLLTSSTLISQEIKRVDSERSSINYSGKHFLHKWSAENKNISGLIQIQNESISNIGIVAKVSDFKSGNSSLDSNSLRVLDALQFPNVIFKSTSVNQENGQIIFEGVMNFHGIEKNFSILADVTQLNGMTQLSGKIIVSLTDFLVKRPSLLTRKIDDEINLEFDLYFK
ncbi:MAG: YceI family protein [Candidatus Marisimplicoccus sp.]